MKAWIRDRCPNTEVKQVSCETHSWAMCRLGHSHLVPLYSTPEDSRPQGLATAMDSCKGLWFIHQFSISKIVSLLKVETRNAERGVGSLDLSDDNVDGEKSIERHVDGRIYSNWYLIKWGDLVKCEDLRFLVCIDGWQCHLLKHRTRDKEVFAGSSPLSDMPNLKVPVRHLSGDIL